MGTTHFPSHDVSVRATPKQKLNSLIHCFVPCETKRHLVEQYWILYHHIPEGGVVEWLKRRTLGRDMAVRVLRTYCLFSSLCWSQCLVLRVRQTSEFPLCLLFTGWEKIRFTIVSSVHGIREIPSYSCVFISRGETKSELQLCLQFTEWEKIWFTVVSIVHGVRENPIYSCVYISWSERKSELQLCLQFTGWEKT